MGKFNKKSSVVTPAATNQMGEKAYVLSAKEELVSTVLTAFLQSSYYEKENEIVKRVIAAASKCDPEFVAKTALYVRREAKMRSSSHLLAGELAPRLQGVEWATRFFKKIVRRPDDMSEILGYIKHKNSTKGDKLKISNPIKRAFKSVIEGMDPYLIDKYKMKGHEFSLKVLLQLFHPKATDKNGKAFSFLMEGKNLSGLYDSKILEKEMSSAGQQAKEENASAEDLRAYKGDAIKDVLTSGKGMPMMNLIRNLRNIIENSPDLVDEACKQLTNKDKVLNSMLLPFRFATAYEEIEKLAKDTSVRSTIQFEKGSTSTAIQVPKVLDTLETAIGYSVANIPKLAGNTAILVDHSGSVRGDAGGSSKVSAFSKATKAMIGNLFGAMMVYSQDNCYLGLFGDQLINVTIDRKMSMLEFAKNSFNEGARCGPSTEKGLYTFLSECIRNRTKVDNLIIFSDMVIGSGGEGTGWDHTSRTGLGTFQKLFAQFKVLNPQCNTVCVDIGQTKGTSVFHQSMKVTQVAGWSEKIFDIVAANSKGYDAIIKEIEAIKI